MQKEGLWKEELEILENLISKFPLEKSIKWGADVFSYNGKNVLSYGGFKNYFSIWFYNGVFLKDKDNLLISAQDKTKSLRQWRFKSKEEIDHPKLMEYIAEAIEIEKKGLRIKPEKFKPRPVPEILAQEFHKNEKLKASFDNLTPGKQKEYMLHINEAKLEKTKRNRLEKIKPLVLQGKGLNDKYK